MKHFFNLRIVFLIMLVCFCHQSMAQSNGVTFLDSLNRGHGISGQGNRFSSCWGWVSPDGREYALLGTYTGTAIIDMNSPPRLREVQFIAGPQATYAYREMKTYKNYAYIISEGGWGVQIVDLSGLPDTAILVRNFNYTSGGRNILRSHTVTLADGYLYLNGSANWSPSGVVIFSLREDPTNPQYVGQYQPEYIHDAYVRNDTLYAAAIYGGGCYVVNIQNKANPQLIRWIQYSNAGTHNTWASINGGRYVFTTDEINHPQKNLKVWDLQNLGPGPPYTPLAQYQASPADIIHNVHGRGNYAYIAHYTAGMRVVDVHNPALPVEVGWYDSYPGPSGGYNGCWAVYPYFPSGRWIGSDMQTGLYMLSFSGLAPRIRSPLAVPANGDTVGQSGSIGFRWRQAANQAEDPHYYKLHIFGAGFDTLITVRDTAYTLTTLSSLQNNQTYRWHVWVLDEYTEVSSQDTFRFTFNDTPVSVGEQSFQPRTYSLHQNHPNPFNPTTTIQFEVGHYSFVTLKVYNVLGKEIATLVNERKEPGRYSVNWNAGNVPSGVYFYRLRAGTFIDTKRMILLK